MHSMPLAFDFVLDLDLDMTKIYFMPSDHNFGLDISHDLDLDLDLSRSLYARTGILFLLAQISICCQQAIEMSRMIITHKCSDRPSL